MKFIVLFLLSHLLGQYPAVAVAGSPTGVVPSSQHQIPITSQPQPEMYMSGVQMNGSGMGPEYQTGQNVGANVQSQVSVGDEFLTSSEVPVYIRAWMKKSSYQLTLKF